jgi:hypothetical protein
LIANAEHYVYIENQFFVSMIGSTEVVNEISRVLCDRIVRAHRDKQVFRVYILVPLLPGFEGKINSTDYSALLAVLHWTMVIFLIMCDSTQILIQHKCLALNFPRTVFTFGES